MGEMADWIVMNGFEAMLEGNDGYEDQMPVQNILCRYCGKDGFHWEETDKGWRLYDGDCKIHLCKTKKG